MRIPLNWEPSATTDAEQHSSPDYTSQGVNSSENSSLEYYGSQSSNQVHYERPPDQKYDILDWVGKKLCC